MRKLGQFLSGHHLFLAYIIFGAVILIGFMYLIDLASTLERQGMQRTHEICMSQNELRNVLAGVLDTLAEPRDSDEPGDYERRQHLRDEVDPYIQPQVCPPKVDDGPRFFRRSLNKQPPILGERLNAPPRVRYSKDVGQGFVQLR